VILREIVTWPLRQVDRLNPLDAGAGYMLRNYPTLWRTSILKIIWYLFVAHLALWLAGWWVSQSYTFIPAAGEILSFSGAILALALLIGFGWFVSVWQTPLIKRTLGSILLTWAVYAACIYGLATTTQAYFAPVSAKVAGFYEPHYLKHDAAALADPLAYACNEPDAADPRAAVRRLHAGHPDHDALNRMVDALFEVGTSHCEDMRAPTVNTLQPTRVPLTILLDEIYGFQPLQMDAKFSGYIQEVRGYYKPFPNVPFIDELVVARDAQLDSRLNAVQLAHFTTHKRHHMRYAKSIVQPGMAVFAMFLALVILTLELKGRRWLNATLSLMGRSREHSSSGSGPISRINARIIRTRPVVWQLRLPAAVTLMLLVIFGGWFAVPFTGWVNDLLESQLRGHINSNFATIIIVVGLLVVYVSLIVALMQVQRRYFQLDLRRHWAGAQFFLALFFPVLAACLVGSVVTAMEIGNDATGNGVVWYGAAVCAYVAATFSWSQTFLGLRAAIILATVFAALSGLMMFVLIVNVEDDAVLQTFAFAALAALFLVVVSGWFGKLDVVNSPAVVVIVVYSVMWTNLGTLLLIEGYGRGAVPLHLRALSINLVFVVMAVCLLPLFNRLQEIAMAPADD
jgi:hypothetical protein